jgi:hypothetical protein
MRMRLRFSLWALSISLLGVLCAQQSSDSEPVKTTLCELYQNPEQYQGRIVSVRGTIAGYRETLVDSPASSAQPPCSAYMTILLDVTENVSPKPNFELEKDAVYGEYEDAQAKGLRIEVTLEGRFDPVFTWKERKRIRVAEGEGFGRKHAADARIVLRRMTDLKTWSIPRR